MSNRTIERKNAPDLKALIEQMGNNTTEAIKQLTERMDGFELKAKRPGAGGAEDEARALELKNLGHYARGELKAMNVASDPDGGYTVESALSPTMLKRIHDESPMRRLANTITISSGDAYEEPIDTEEVGAEWVGEQEGRPATATPKLKMRTIPVDEMYALAPLTQRLIDDSRFDMGRWIEGKIGEKFGRKEAAACINGTSIKQPRGFMTLPVATTGDLERPWGTLQYVVSGSAGAVSDAAGGANGIKDLYWSMRAAHRSNATWLMASSTANALDNLKDGNNNYIWRPGMTAGAPPSLLGRPVEFDENMPAIGANTFPVAFGDFKAGYTIVDKLGILYLRDPLTSRPLINFYAYRRVGGDVANSDAIKLLKISN